MAKTLRSPWIGIGLAASLVLASCAAPASLQDGHRNQASAVSSTEHQGDALSVRVKLPPSASKGARFHTLDALATEAAYVRLVIKAADLSREYTNTGGITLNGIDHLEAITPAEAESGKLLTVANVPRGSNRLVIAQVYDAQGRELTSLRAMGLYHSRDDVPEGSTRFADEDASTFVIEQTVSRRYLPLLSMLEAAIDNNDEDFLDAIENHLDTLAQEFDELVYGTPTPAAGAPFVVDPQSLDFAEIYTLLSAEVANESFEPETELDAFFTANQASFTESPVDVTVWLATPTGFDFTQDMKVLIDDPNSSETSVTSTNADSPLSVIVNDVVRGTRRLTVTSADGLVLGHTTVTVDPDVSPGYVFAGGAGSSPANPLVLVGGETGIVISSIVSPNNILAEVQGTAMTLNGVGYAENPNQGANIVKFTHNNNGEGAVTVPPTSATTTSVNLNVPDLIGGTYLITVERLGVISNSRNFSIVPVAAQLEQPAASVVTTAANGSTLTVRGTGFDPDPADNTVYFGTTEMIPSAVAGDRHSLTVQVPASTFGTQSVAVRVGGQTSATTAFKIKPVISGLKTLAETTTTTARIGDEILIDGTGFSTNDGGNTVSFGSVTVPQADIQELSENRLRVKVPANVWGTANVTVAVEGVSSASSAFQVTPTISASGLSPTNGIIGSNLTITGSGFGPTASDNTVKFGLSTVPAGDITVNSNTSMTVKVPAGVYANPPVSVQVGSRQSNQDSSFHVTPTISSFRTPSNAVVTSGRIGSTVVIHGTGFSPTAAQNSVDFDSPVAATVISSTNTTLTLRIPGRSLDAGSRDVNVTVGTRTSADSSFTALVTTPCVESDFSPSLLNAQEPLRYVDCFDDEPTGNSGPDFNGSDTYLDISRTNDRFGAPVKAYHFPGGQSYRKLNWNINPSVMDDVTISLWARIGPLDDTTQTDPDWNPLSDVFALISSDNGPFDRAISLEPRGDSPFGWAAFAGVDPNILDGDLPLVGSNNAQLGQWVHLVAVYDQSADTVRLYVNGALDEVGTTDMGDGFPFVLVGRNPGGFGDRAFFGAVDDVMVYKEALNGAQIQALYDATRP